MGELTSKDRNASGAVPPVEPASSEADDRGGGGRDRPRRKGGAQGDVGQALRSAYQETIDEDVPDDLLDLLGKLS